ncbi:MAG: ABC transporter transmembrane domain-containing protein, partial [Firmicutes bacterium]|nr:ABC transporter transmembrane domain-containing protein [Bacillota bacterium]
MENESIKKQKKSPPVQSKIQRQEEKQKQAKERKESRQNFGKGMKYLLKYLLKFWPSLLFATIFTLAAAVVIILSPTYMQVITDTIIDAVTVQGLGQLFGIDSKVYVIMHHITRFGIIVTALYVSNFVFNYIQVLIMVRVNNNAAMDLRSKISKKINLVPLSFFDKNK